MTACLMTVGLLGKEERVRERRGEKMKNGGEEGRRLYIYFFIMRQITNNAENLLKKNIFS